MALPRVAFPLVLQSPSTGSALVGANATITKHVVGGSLGAGAEATIFTEETGAGKTASNVITTDNTGRWTQGSSEGYKQYWIEEGRYDILISGTGLTSVYITRELVTGGVEAVTTERIANTAVTAGKIGSEAVETAKIKAEAVTDAKIVKGRALVETENKYSARVEHSSGETITPSSTRSSIVIICIELASESGPTGELKVEVGGIVVAEISNQIASGKEIMTGAVTIFVPPGVAWKPTFVNAAFLKSSTLLL